jgi:hypothetical protein
MSLPYVFSWVNPIADNEHYPEWLTQPEFDSGTEVSSFFPGSGFAFSTLPSALLQSFIIMTDGEFDPSEFNSCGISPFGEVNDRVRAFGIVCAGVYSVLTSIIMINILIAIMSASFQRLNDRGNAQVYYNEAELLCDYSSNIDYKMARNRRKKTNQRVLDPRVVYVLGKSNAAIEQKDEHSSEAADGRNHVNSIMKSAWEASLEFVETVDQEVATQEEEAVDSVIGQMDLIDTIEKDLENLIRITKK